MAEAQTYIRGHHWRAQREARGVPESKVCVHCGQTFARTDVRQREKHWLERQFCSDDCRKAARAVHIPGATEKRCSRCKQVKPVAEFHRHAKRPDGLQTRCKPCLLALKKPVLPEIQRDRNLRQFYGITAAEYDAMLAAQGGVCAICARPESAKRRGKVFALAVDHCHDLGHVRGLLCGNCNKGIGGLGHDTGRLEAAIAYLRRTGGAR